MVALQLALQVVVHCLVSVLGTDSGPLQERRPSLLISSPEAPFLRPLIPYFHPSLMLWVTLLAFISLLSTVRQSTVLPLGVYSKFLSAFF